MCLGTHIRNISIVIQVRHFVLDGLQVGQAGPVSHKPVPEPLAVPYALHDCTQDELLSDLPQQ